MTVFSDSTAIYLERHRDVVWFIEHEDVCDRLEVVALTDDLTSDEKIVSRPINVERRVELLKYTRHVCFVLTIGHEESRRYERMVCWGGGVLTHSYSTLCTDTCSSRFRVVIDITVQSQYLSDKDHARSSYTFVKCHALTFCSAE